MQFVKFKDGNIISVEEIVSIFGKNPYGESKPTSWVVSFKNGTSARLDTQSEYDTVVKLMKSMQILTEE